MTRDQILTRLDWERRHLPVPGMEIATGDHTTRIWANDGGAATHHSILWSALNDESADATIEAELAHYHHLRTEFEWKVYAHDRPSDLLTRLRAKGFEIGPQETVMIFDLTSPPNWTANLPRVERIDHESQLPLFKQLAESIFGKDWSYTTEQLRDALRQNSLAHRAYLAYNGPTPAGIARLYLTPGSHFAGLYGAGVLPTHRGQGLYRALISARAHDALAHNLPFLQVDALPTSRPILQRLGFFPLTETWPCTYRPT